MNAKGARLIENSAPFTFNKLCSLKHSVKSQHLLNITSSTFACAQVTCFKVFRLSDVKVIYALIKG